MRGAMLVVVLTTGGMMAMESVAQQRQEVTAPQATAIPASPTERGIALFEARNYAEARTALGRAVAANPADAAAQAYLGLVLLNYDHDADEARTHLEAAVSLEPGSSRYHQWLGALYSSQAMSAGFFKAAGLARKSKEELEKAVELDSRDLGARSALLQYYLQAPGVLGGSVDKARDQAIAITELDRYRGLLAQGGIAEHEKDPKRAEELYRSAVAVAPKEGLAYNSLGYLLLASKRRAEALDMFRTYVEVSPEEANAHDSLAEGLLVAGQVDESIAEYHKALALDAAFSASYLGLARCYEKKSAWQQAREALERFLEIVPNGRRAEEARDKVEELKRKRG